MISWTTKNLEAKEKLTVELKAKIARKYDAAGKKNVTSFTTGFLLRSGGDEENVRMFLYSN